MMKKIKIKAWTVIWAKEAREPYGIESDDELIVVVEPKEEIKYRIGSNKGRPKYRYAGTEAIFSSKEESEAFRAGNKDWESIPCTVTYSL